MFIRFLLFALMGVGIIGFTGVAWMASHSTNDAVAAAFPAAIACPTPRAPPPTVYIPRISSAP